MPDNLKSTADELSLKAIVDKILAAGHTLCSDASERQFIKVTTDPKHRWRTLDSGQVRAWIAKFAYDLGKPLVASEITVIVGILKGVALENEHDGLLPQYLWQTAEDDPVLLAVILFMQNLRQNSWNGSMTELLTVLRQQVADGRSMSSRLPVLPNHLSRRLGKLATPLRQMGVQYSRRHTNDGTQVTFQRHNDEVSGDDDIAPSSPPSSPPIRLGGHELIAPNDGDGNITNSRVLAQIRSVFEGENQK